jgi:formylglycine-generating enzyme required for sulfatase activity
VVNVSWNDAAAFCNWLSDKEGKRYRLPTEAEWEYACRAGTTARFPTGDEDSSLKDAANIGDVSLKKSWDAATWVVSWNDGFAFTSPVGTWKPNGWGIYDMVGNAGEWTQDWFDPEYYQKSPATEPRGPATGEFRVVRGGAWYYHPPFQRSAMRVPGCPPSSRNVLVGFRVVREQ